LALVHAAVATDRGQIDFSSSLWCEVGSNLVSLNLSSNGLAQVPTSINGSCKHGYRHLEVLNLSDNVMTDLDGLSSSPQLLAPSLTHLDVSNNRLQVFKLPNNMSQLKFVDVSENKLTSSLVLGALSASAATLQELHAQGNQMESLPNLSTDDGGSVINFDNLVVLNLSRNAISQRSELKVGGGHLVAAGFKALVALDLSHNKMSLVDGHLFRDLSSLQVLSLAHNQLVELRPDSLAKLTRLHVLVLSHNNLDENGLADGIFRHMADLRSLSLDHNRLKSLPR
jgi:adenylate cyclase